MKSRKPIKSTKMPSQQEQIPSTPHRQEAHAVFDSFDLDLVAKVLRKTIFSPFFCVFIPLSILSQVKDKHHSAVYWSGVWAGFLIVIQTLRHIDRIYANQWSWLFTPPKLKWEDQIVLITGGGSGVGALLAETLAMRNVSVVVLDRVKPNFETLNENISSYICDISDFSEVENIANQVREEVGAPTIIINNAGVVKGKLLLDLTENDVTDTFGANVISHFWILKAFLPDMIRVGTGHVVSIASILGIMGVAQGTDYCASKSAVVNLHSSLRFELDNRYLTPGIRTTILMPSWIQTKLFAAIQFPQHWIWDWLAPPIAPHTIVKAIIEALDAHESRVIRLPFYTQLARFTNLYFGLAPTWLVNLIQWVTNADHSLKAYGPHPDAAEKLIAERNARKSS